MCRCEALASSVALCALLTVGSSVLRMYVADDLLGSFIDSTSTDGTSTLSTALITSCTLAGGICLDKSL